MRLSKLALYVDEGRCPVSDKSAGHTGRKGKCDACESNLDAEGVRERVTARVERTQALGLDADAKGWEIAKADEGKSKRPRSAKSTRKSTRKPAAAAANVITAVAAGRMTKQALIEFLGEGGSVEG